MKSKNNLATLLQKGTHFMQEKLGVYPIESELAFYSNQQFEEFTQLNNFEKNSTGIYVPKAKKSYINAESKYSIPTLFHEHFGHGTYCEHSLIMNPDFGTMDESKLGIFSQSTQNYEGFAMWVEYLLSREFGFENLFQEKLLSLPQMYLDLLSVTQQFEQKMGRFVFLSTLGFPKCYSSQDLIDVFETLFDINLTGIDFLILNGSKKPYSDIDIFMVSDYSYVNHDMGWLDIYGRGKDEFKQHIKQLDFSTTQRVLTGELLHGDKREFERIKNQIKTQEITQEAIDHNYNMAEELEKHSKKRKNKTAQTYRIAAKKMERGEKVLKLESILNS